MNLRRVGPAGNLDRSPGGRADGARLESDATGPRLMAMTPRGAGLQTVRLVSSERSSDPRPPLSSRVRDLGPLHVWHAKS
jgi:hypothetical protein